MAVSNILVLLLIAFGFSFIVREIFRKLGFPDVAGQIIAGIILGLPLLKSLIFTAASLSIMSFLSQLGILFLLFLAGLKIDLRKIRKVAKDAILIAFSSAFLPFIFGFFLLQFFGYNFTVSIIFGIALAVTSETTKTKVLLDLGVLNTRLGATMLSAGVVDDIIEVLGLSLVLVLAYGGGPEKLLMFPLQIIIFVVATFVMFKLLARGLIYFERESDVNLFSVVIIFLLLVAGLSEILGIGFLIGAIVAGFLLQISIKKVKKKDEENIIETIKLMTLAFIVPFFFINIGLNFNINQLFVNPILLILALIIAFGGKIFGTLFVKPFSKLKLRQLHLIGWGMNSRGVVEMVIALTAFQFKLIPIEIFSVLVATSVMTTLVFPFVLQSEIKKNPKIMN